jgi:hypothetical protein
MELGRPTIYSEEIVLDILERISEGKSLRSICEDEKLPTMRTVLRWKLKYPDFCHQYDAACQERADSFAEDMIHIADNAKPENVNVAKLKISTRMWNASRMKPKKYGEKTEEQTKQVPIVISTYSETDETTDSDI